MLNTFDNARMRALKEYANVEYELCFLFKAILAVEGEIAAAIFYQIISTRTRYAILESMLEVRYADTFLKPWPKLEKWLTPRDTARNHIVHWGQDSRIVVAPESKGKELYDPDAKLIVHESPLLTNNARKWRSPSPGAKTYSEADIRAEEKAARVMKHIINRFRHCVNLPEAWPWTDIFQQPITDQTPMEFLSRLNDRGLPAQLGS